ncbi:MAG: DUF1294 domain-containing protein [Oscillospiraceae bacterium]|nr:DUF1294 domain-containing protein [Oscillospiraceae bacterium]
MKIIVIYLLLINAAGLLLMRSDKKRSQNNRWRIRERTLIGVAVFGGSIGVFAGMRIFRHKTKHPKFYMGIPLILTLQIMICVLYLSHNI